MQLSATCDHCFTSFQVPSDAVGRRVRCKSCGEAFLVAADDAENPYVDDLPAPRASSAGKTRQRKQSRRSASGARSWWLKGALIGAAVLISVAGLSWAGVYALKSNGIAFAPPFERIVRRYIDAKLDAAAVLEGVTDKASAARAVPKLEASAARMEGLVSEIETLDERQEITAEERHRVTELLAGQLRDTDARFKKSFRFHSLINQFDPENNPFYDRFTLLMGANLAVEIKLTVSAKLQRGGNVLPPAIPDLPRPF